MKVLSLFDGMSCGQIALKELGIIPEVYYASEIDKNAIAMTQYNFPNTVQLGNVMDLDARKLGHIDLLIGGSPCFAAGTKVLTKDGYKNIEDVKIGDMVLTHKNRWRKVIDFGSKIADTYELNTQCSKPIVCTPNHNFWARKKSFEWKNEIRTRRLELGNAEWVEAKDLKDKYYVCMNKATSCGNGLDISIEEAWILGRYIADGHTRKDLRNDAKHNGTRSWQLIISVGDDKLEELKKHVASTNFSCFHHTKSTYRVVFSSKKLVELAEKNFGCGAANKFISEDVFSSSYEIKKAILEGYLSGDGSVSGNKVQICTVSHNLALGLQRIILDVEKQHSNIYYYDRGSKWIIDGREVNQQPQYVIHYTRGTKGKIIDDEDKIWFGVKKWNHVGEQVVYNITVDEDHSYTVENVVVKNCTNFSFAGRRNGMNTKGGDDNETIEIYTLEHYLKLKAEGFQFDGESFLFWEYMRILGELRETNPNVLFFLENVEMDKKWESCLTKAIGIRGVHINSALVSAQTRKRIYWTNIRTKTEGLFGWVEPDIPQPKDRGILLQDVLEDNVDEKYYLKQEVVDKLLGAVNNEVKKSNPPEAEETVDNTTIPDDEGEDVYNGKPLEGFGLDGTDDVHP